jgi:hypothetical protein
MPEIRPINATTHLKCAFDVEYDHEQPMTQLRYSFREWCKQRTGDDPKLTGGWFFRGNHPSEPNVVINGHQLRTAIAFGDDMNEPPGWAFEMIHKDSAENARRWSAEIMLRKLESGKLRFSTVISHWMIPNYIGHYPELPAPSVPKYVRWILNDEKIKCTRNGSSISNKFEVVTHETAKNVYEQLKNPHRSIPFVFVAADRDSQNLAVDPVRLYRYVLGNANVFAFFDNSVLEEMNYYLGSDFRCGPGSVRCYLTPFNKNNPDNTRIHRYFSPFDIEENGQDYVVGCIANGLAKNGTGFHPRDLKSFSDLFVLRRRLRLNRLLSEQGSNSEDVSEELQMFMDECQTLECENAELKTLTDQLDAENKKVNQELGTKNYLIKQAEEIQKQFKNFEQVKNAVESLNTLPESLADVLRLAGQLFPQRLEIASGAFKSAEDHERKNQGFWNKPEGLSIAWELLFDLAQKGHDLIFGKDQKDVEKEFNNKSRFSYAKTEGRTTKGDAKLMKLRNFVHEGAEYKMTPHIKFGTKNPKMIRAHFAIDNKNKRLIVGHFGDHLDNATTRSKS